MITEFKSCANPRQTAVFYYSNFQQIMDYYEDFGPEEAGEFAISLLELGFTGQISSDDKHIKVALRNFEAMAEKNKERYEAKINTKREYEIEDKGYRFIADMTLQGMTQQEIANKLGVSRQTVNNRLAKIRIEYPELLRGESKESKDLSNNFDILSNELDTVSKKSKENVKPLTKSQESQKEISKSQKEKSKQFDIVSKNVKECKESQRLSKHDNVNVNDNVNDNVTDNVNESGSEASTTFSKEENGKNGKNPNNSYKTEKPEKPSLFPVPAERTELEVQQPTTMSIPHYLNLVDWRAQVGELCKSLADWEQDLLRAELSKLSSNRQAPCWIYCALKKMKVAPGRIKDNAYRLNYPDFQREVDEMVDAERAELEQRIKQQKEIENSISIEPPKKQVIVVPRLEKERPKEIYNIEDF